MSRPRTDDPVADGFPGRLQSGGHLVTVRTSTSSQTKAVRSLGVRRAGPGRSVRKVTRVPEAPVP